MHEYKENHRKVLEKFKRNKDYNYWIKHSDNKSLEALTKFRQQTSQLREDK